MNHARAPLILGAALVLSTNAALAQAPKEIPVHQDAEIQELLNDYARPLSVAARLPAKTMRVHIVEHDDEGLFLVDAHTLFVTTASLVGARAPNSLIGQLAHEMGHLVNGHDQKLRTTGASIKNQKIVIRFGAEVLTHRLKRARKSS